jgi:hypothetical protein
MENKNTIQAEQKEINSPIFNTLENNNIFTVPDGYFDELPLKVLGKIQDLQFEVPELYFEELPLKVLGSLQESASVPEGYFDNLAVEVLGKISSTENSQEIPVGYFEGLSAGILQRIKAEEQELSSVEEMKLLSPTIAQIGNQNPFTVPAGYFENNVKSIKDQIAPRKVAPVVQMGTARKVLRYAVAAVVTGLLGFGLYTFNLDENTAEVNPAIMAQAGKIIETNSIDAAFNSLTEDDITDYMTSKGSNIDAALVAATINDADLPAAEDYLFDEEALNDYLKEKHILN